MQKIVGVIEEVGVKGKKGFTNLEELWEILNPKKRNRGTWENDNWKEKS